MVLSVWGLFICHGNECRILEYVHNLATPSHYMYFHLPIMFQIHHGRKQNRSKRKTRPSTVDQTNNNINSCDREIAETYLPSGFQIEQPRDIYDSQQHYVNHQSPSYVNVNVREKRRERQRQTVSDRLSSATSDDSHHSKQSQSHILQISPTVLPRKRRRRRLSCILPMIAVIILIVLGIIAAVCFMLLWSSDVTENKGNLSGLFIPG